MEAVCPACLGVLQAPEASLQVVPPAMLAGLPEAEGNAGSWRTCTSGSAETVSQCIRYVLTAVTLSVQTHTHSLWVGARSKMCSKSHAFLGVLFEIKTFRIRGARAGCKVSAAAVKNMEIARYWKPVAGNTATRVAEDAADNAVGSCGCATVRFPKKKCCCRRLIAACCQVCHDMIKPHLTAAAHRPYFNPFLLYDSISAGTNNGCRVHATQLKSTFSGTDAVPW